MKLPEDVPDCMVFLLAKAYQKAHAQFKKQLKPYGLTNLQHLVLEALWYRQGMTASMLCRSLILDKATLSGTIDRMIKGGWIEKKRSTEDKRQFALFTSRKADTLKDILVKVRIETNTDLLKKFSMEEKILLKRFLMDIIDTE